MTVRRRLWIICVIYVLCLSCFRVCLLLPCGHLLGKDWPLGSCLWCLIVFSSLSHVVSLVRCSTWLYRFLIFAAFLTFIFTAYDASSPEITYTYYTFNFCVLFMKPSITVHWGLMEDCKELVCFVKIDFRFKPSSKIFYWPFQGGTSFVDLLCFCSVLCLLCLCARLFICALWSPAGKGLTSWLSFVVSTVSLSLSHWYPGSGVVLDCINIHSFLWFVV